MLVQNSSGTNRLRGSTRQDGGGDGPRAEVDGSEHCYVRDPGCRDSLCYVSLFGGAFPVVWWRECANMRWQKNYFDNIE